MTIFQAHRSSFGFTLWFIALLVTVLIPPINDLFRLTLLIGGLLLLLFSQQKADGKRMALVTLVLLGIVLLRLSLPIAQVEERNHVFLTKGQQQNEPWRTSLPAPILADFAQAFDRAYPPDKRCDPKTYGCWQFFSWPTEPVGWSADNFWQRKKDISRLDRSITVHDLTTARLGAFNDLTFNWYNTGADGKPLSDIRRESAPFWLHFNLPPEAVGGKLCWQGALWQRNQESASLNRQDHKSIECETLSPSALPQDVWMGFIDPQDGSSLTLDWPASQKAWRGLDFALACLGVFCLVFFSLRPRWKELAYGASLTLAAAIVFAFYNPALFLGVLPYSGGDDGLVHSSYGREIVRALFNGEWMKALRGSEDVFYFMPGLRYFIALENILFGEMRYGEAMVVLFFPLLLWRLFKHLDIEIWTLPVLALGFLPYAVNVIGMTYPSLIDLASRSMAEPVGYSLWLAGLLVAVKNIKEPTESAATHWFLAGLLWALATFLRPNLVVASVLVIAFCGITLLRHRKRLSSLFLGAGFALLVVCLAHNFFFGGRFVLLTSAGQHAANLLMPPATYLEAARALGEGAWQKPCVLSTLKQFARWMGNNTTGKLQDMVLISLPHAALFMTLGILLFKNWRRKQNNRITGLLLSSALGLHLPLFFFHPDNRYAMLAWFVTFILLLTLLSLKKGRVECAD